MQTNSRRLFLILFGLPALLVIPVAMLGSSVYRAGSIEVEVMEKRSNGCDIGLTVPAAIVPMALAIAPDQILDEIRCEIEGEAAYALDVARAAWKELSRAPDGVFVEVIDGAEFVTIEKRDGKLQVFVDTPDERVRVEVPFSTVASVLSSI